MEKTLDELKAEATSLGIEFAPRISADKLAEKIEAFYNAQSSADAVKVKTDDEVIVPVAAGNSFQAIIAKAKAEAFKTRVVTISSNDKRDSEYTTTAYLSMENQHFGVSKLIPLDIPIELEQCLIEVAQTTMITLHKDEIIDGRRTGNKIPTSVRKYNVSFEDMKA